eukprot:426285-Pleurochrysis_carterae.AAC.1
MGKQRQGAYECQMQGKRKALSPPSTPVSLCVAASFSQIVSVVIRFASLRRSHGDAARILDNLVLCRTIRCCRVAGEDKGPPRKTAIRQSGRAEGGMALRDNCGIDLFNNVVISAPRTRIICGEH